MLGLGDREHLAQILLDSGLRQRGLGELDNELTSIGPADFRSWIKSGTQDGLARQVMRHCFGEGAAVTNLSDEMVDGLFARIDKDGGGSLDAEELAAFFEAEVRNRAVTSRH